MYRKPIPRWTTSRFRLRCRRRDNLSNSIGKYPAQIRFSVTPSLLSEDQDSLPLNASRYVQVAPDASTVFHGGRSSAPNGAKPMTASLTIVPLTLSISSDSVSAGQSAVLNFSGPNNGSSYFLTLSAGELHHSAHSRLMQRHAVYRQLPDCAIRQQHDVQNWRYRSATGSGLFAASFSSGGWRNVA